MPAQALSGDCGAFADVKVKYYAVAVGAELLLSVHSLSPASSARRGRYTRRVSKFGHRAEEGMSPRALREKISTDLREGFLRAPPFCWPPLLAPKHLMRLGHEKAQMTQESRLDTIPNSPWREGPNHPRSELRSDVERSSPETSPASVGGLSFLGTAKTERSRQLSGVLHA